MFYEAQNRQTLITKWWASQSRKNSPGSACRQVPSLNLFAICPGVVYQSDTTCRCGESPAGRLKRGQDLSRRTAAPLITLPDSITPSQGSRPQTSKIHNFFTAHTQNSLQKFFLWEKQLDSQGQFAPRINSVLRSHLTTTCTSLLSLFISKKSWSI